MANYYQLLGLPKDATDDEVKRAYRKLAQQYHPDRNPSPQAAKHFAELTAAYRVLADPHQRARYDAAGAHTQPTGPVSTGPQPITRRELSGAIERIGAYGVTGLGVGIIIEALTRWLADIDPLLSWPASAPIVAATTLIGLMWGIDANFYIATFVPRPLTRTLIRVVRAGIWSGGLAVLGWRIGSLAEPILGTPQLTELVTLGAASVGFLIALWVTHQDH